MEEKIMTYNKKLSLGEVKCKVYSQDLTRTFINKF